MANGANHGTGHRAYATLRHRDYRLLLFAEGISVTGSQINRVAVAWLIFKLTGDALALGILGLCRFVPVILFGVAGGVIADRYDRRKLLIVSQTLLMATSGVMAYLTWSGNVTLLWIYGLTITASIVEAINNPTRQALIPLLVPREDLAGATTMNILVMQIASIGGPALGGLILAAKGVPFAYAIDAISFGAVLVAVLVMHARPVLPPITMSGFAAALEGLRFLKSSPVLLGSMMTDFVATIFGASTLLMPIFAEEILQVGPRGLGLLVSAPSAGAVAVGVIMGIARLPKRPGIGILVSVLIWGLCLIGFGLSRNLWLSVAFLAAGGAADMVSMTYRSALRTILSPDELRGRIAAVHRTLAVGGPQLGEFESGVAAALIGASAAVVLGGVGTLLTVAVIALMVPSIGRFRLGEDGSPQTPVASGVQPAAAGAKAPAD